jgi:hypothetical protein
MNIMMTYAHHMTRTYTTMDINLNQYFMVRIKSIVTYDSVLSWRLRLRLVT